MLRVRGEEGRAIGSFANIGSDTYAAISALKKLCVDQSLQFSLDLVDDVHLLLVVAEAAARVAGCGLRDRGFVRMHRDLLMAGQMTCMGARERWDTLE